MTRRNRWGFRTCVVTAALLAALVGAPGVPTSAGGSQSRGRAPSRPTGEGGSIAGVVRVEGKLPPPRVIWMGADPVCVSLNRRETRADDIVVRGGRLANAFVYVEGAALDSHSFAPPQTPAVLARRRCRTVPHVLGLQAGQTLRVLNDDPTIHNYSFHPAKNPRRNKAIERRGESFEVRFDEPEPPFPVRCNQHPWERGSVAVMPHPFFAVTDRRGAFDIKGLPPGEYTVHVWHEKLGPLSTKVTVGRGDVKTVNFRVSFAEHMR
jgi:plastocyanin